MSSPDHTLLNIGWPLAVAVVILGAVAAAVNRCNGPFLTRATVVAIIRAAAQLLALALIIGFVIRSLWLSALFIALMAVVASWTSAGRVSSCRATVPATMRCLVPVAASSVIIVAVLVVIGVLPPSGLAIIPTAGIMLGGAMNTTSIAGRRAHEELRLRHGELEAALSLGFSSRDARLEITRDAAVTALIPGLDQTRSVGLVTIPGAFVGMILGGASTTSAAIMQLFVLISLLAVSSVAALITVELIARNRL